MTTNFVENWYSTDNRLKEIIDKITLTNRSFEEQAKEAFTLVSDMFNLPKYPDDITEDYYAQCEEEGIFEVRTVFEEVGIIRYLEPDDDPRGIVLFALHNIKHKTYMDIDYCAIKHFGGKRKVPKEYMVYYTGEDSDSKLNFLNDGESWLKPGVRCASKIIKIKKINKDNQNTKDEKRTPYIKWVRQKGLYFSFLVFVPLSA